MQPASVAIYGAMHAHQGMPSLIEVSQGSWKALGDLCQTGKILAQGIYNARRPELSMCITSALGQMGLSTGAIEQARL